VGFAHRGLHYGPGFSENSLLAFAAAFLVGSLVLLELGTRWTVRWQSQAVQRSGIFSYRERVRAAIRT